jgi:hypothetical protein
MNADTTSEGRNWRGGMIVHVPVEAFRSRMPVKSASICIDLWFNC